MCHLMINEHGMYHYTTVDEIAFLPMKCVLHTAQQDPTLLSSIITYLVHLSICTTAYLLYQFKITLRISPEYQRSICHNRARRRERERRGRDKTEMR